MKPIPIVRALCHSRGVSQWDAAGQPRGFALPAIASAKEGLRRSVSPERHRHSDSEWKRRSVELVDSEVIHAFNDDGTLGLAALPPDFNL